MICGVIVVILEYGIFAVISAVHISNCTRLCVTIAMTFAISREIAPINIFAYPNNIIPPVNGVAIILDIINTVDILLKFIIVTGNTIICADMVIASISDTFLFMYFSKKLLIGLFKYTIPSVPKYDNCKPISFIANGLSINIINNDTDIDVKISGFLYTIFANSKIIPIMHALITDGLKFVMNIKNINEKIVIIYIPFLDVLLFVSIYVIPIII